MPYIEGETLREKLNRETQLGVEEAVRIATDVAEALSAAHEAGVIHRDIKSENVLLHKGRAMVADFGMALAVSAAAGGRMTETGLSLGTPHYMSPEQATILPGDAFEVGERRVLFSLAGIPYGAWDAHPDGERIIAARNWVADAGSLIVVENLFEELRAKPGN